jgi:hypothetical protein
LEVSMKIIVFQFGLLISFIFAGTALAGVPMIVGDYVWFDENGNGLQDDGAENGINGVRVIFYRDYECNGVIDGNDEIYDYDYTANDEYATRATITFRPSAASASWRSWTSICPRRSDFEHAGRTVGGRSARLRLL